MALSATRLIYVSNTGVDMDGGFVVTGTLPGTLTFSAAQSDNRCSAVGQAVTCTGGALLNGQDTAFDVVGTIVGHGDGSFAATVAPAAGGLDTDGTPGNDTDSTGVSIYGLSDIVTTGSVSPGQTVNVGDTVAVATNFRNDGPDTANVAVAVTLPTGFEAVAGPLPAGCNPIPDSSTAIPSRSPTASPAASASPSSSASRLRTGPGTSWWSPGSTRSTATTRRTRSTSR